MTLADIDEAALLRRKEAGEPEGHSASWEQIVHDAPAGPRVMGSNL